MPDYTNGIEAEYWDDDPDVESLTHRTLADAVGFYVVEECGVSPRAYERSVLTPPPGYVLGQLSASPAEMRIVSEFNSQVGGPEDFLECLRVLPRRSFFAWKRGVVKEPLIKSIAEDLAERTLEHGLEDMLDPDGLRVCDKVLLRRLEEAFAPVLHKHLVNATWHPWHCEQIGQVTLSAVQMEAMMREHNPHWF